MATNSRRIGYLIALMKKMVIEDKDGMLIWRPGVEITITQKELHLCMPVDLVLRCYRPFTAKSSYSIRTITHFLPRMTKDPLVQGFRHKKSGKRILHRVRLPTEILERALILQKTEGMLKQVARFRQLFTDLKPVNDPALISGRARRVAHYEVRRLVEAARIHALKWNFDPTNLIQGYLGLASRSVLPPQRELFPVADQVLDNLVVEGEPLNVPQWSWNGPVPIFERPVQLHPHISYPGTFEFTIDND